MALSSGRYSASRTRTASSTAGAVDVGLGTHGDLHPARDVADEPADGLTPRSIEVALGRDSRGAGPSARGRRSAGPRRAPCRTAAPRARGRSLPAGSRTSARTTAPGLMLPTRLSVWNGDIAASRWRSSSSVFRSPDPRLQPAFAGEHQAILLVALSPRRAGSDRPARARRPACGRTCRRRTSRGRRA